MVQLDETLPYRSPIARKKKQSVAVGLTVRQHAKACVHFGPFEGWNVPPKRSVVAEVYPALWNRTFPSEGRTPDQQDAFVITKWPAGGGRR
jgi:hypothetical protein